MKKSKTVLCTGDSLAMPRPGVPYEATWYCKIKQAFPQYDFISQFKRSITTNILVEWGGGDEKASPDFPYGSDCLEHYAPDIVIIQLGIVDCAPRLIKPKGVSYFLLKILPKRTHKVYIKFLKIIKGRNANSVYVTKKKFENNLKNYLSRCEKCNLKKAILIGICYPDEVMITKNPMIAMNIEIYNNIYQRIAKEFEFVDFIFPLDARKQLFRIYDDGYHPNIQGNDLVYVSIADSLSKLNL